MIRDAGRRATGEAGQALPLVVVFLVVLLGFAGMVVDVGHAYVMKRKLQASVDMAVLGAAQTLPATAAAGASAEDLLGRNYDGSSEPDADAAACDDAESTTRICLRATSNVATTFLRVLQVDELDIGVEATATIETYTGFSNVAPWAVKRSLVENGAGFTSEFHLRGRSDYGHSSLRGTISIPADPPACGGSDGVDERDILNGELHVCEISVADAIEDDNGNSNGHLQGLPERGAVQCTGAVDACLEPYSDLVGTAGRRRVTDNTHPNVIMVPVIESWSHTADMPIVAFVWFAITRWNGPNVYGRFLEGPTTLSAGMSCGNRPCQTSTWYAGSVGGKVVRLVG